MKLTSGWFMKSTSGWFMKLTSIWTMKLSCTTTSYGYWIHLQNFKLFQFLFFSAELRPEASLQLNFKWSFYFFNLIEFLMLPLWITNHLLIRVVPVPGMMTNYLLYISFSAFFVLKCWKKRKKVTNLVQNLVKKRVFFSLHQNAGWVFYSQF